ncbi:hypothetical protein CIPAW_06G064400 [Carya illinoinensis]|uniref:Uncharacterized protein n=1 Tax=Carya illinoinensis TaxID=32201 RepID=A0A8T1Q8H8_CARIL|nr:hypothetical protein CIPAW_06G064400 [Carya illinoinensis]
MHQCSPRKLLAIGSHHQELLPYEVPCHKMLLTSCPLTRYFSPLTHAWSLPHQASCTIISLTRFWAPTESSSRCPMATKLHAPEAPHQIHKSVDDISWLLATYTMGSTSWQEMKVVPLLPNKSNALAEFVVNIINRSVLRTSWAFINARTWLPAGIARVSPTFTTL